MVNTAQFHVRNPNVEAPVTIGVTIGGPPKESGPGASTHLFATGWRRQEGRQERGRQHGAALDEPFSIPLLTTCPSDLSKCLCPNIRPNPCPRRHARVENTAPDADWDKQRLGRTEIGTNRDLDQQRFGRTEIWTNNGAHWTDECGDSKNRGPGVLGLSLEGVLGPDHPCANGSGRPKVRHTRVRPCRGAT